MVRTILSNSKTVSRFMFVPAPNGPTVLKNEKSYCEGLFVGYSRGPSLPCYVNFDLLLNPHVFIAGMTGSGKTYLMRSLMLRLSVILGHSVLLMDFTGEYEQFVVASGRRAIEYTSLEGSSLEEEGTILYVNLRGKIESEKVAIAQSVIESFVIYMRSRQFSGKRAFLILDEAWKLLTTSSALATIIREGRKYGVGLVMASQLVEDIELSVLGNVSTMFLFRVQNKQSLDNVAKNYNLSEQLLSQIQNLEIGSCLLIQLYKSNKRDAFLVNRVLGVMLPKTIRVSLGDEMEIEVERSEFEALVKDLCGEKGAEIMGSANEDGTVELHKLIARLTVSCPDRHRILVSLRKLGIADSELADAFAVAMEEIEDETPV